jgi:hypothetical protein
MCCQALRLCAIHNQNDSPHDPLKKAFTLKLMSLPRMFHATVLRLDDKLVSAQIHTYNRDQVLLGLITHWPFYARYSPGELHLLMTGVELAGEGIPVFDLTPGGHYKNRYATRHDEVYVAIIFFNRLRCVQYMKQALENLEAGHHIYTSVEDGKLKQYCWLIEPQDQKPAAADGRDFVVPDDGVLLADYYSHPEGRSLSKTALCQVLRDAANAPGATRAYIRIPAEHYALRQMVEGVGFAYQ